MKADRTTRIEKTERVVVEEKEVSEWNLTLSDDEMALITLVLGDTYSHRSLGDEAYNLYVEFSNKNVNQPFKFVPYESKFSDGYEPRARMVQRR